MEEASHQSQSITNPRIKYNINRISLRETNNSLARQGTGQIDLSRSNRIREGVALSFIIGNSVSSNNSILDRRKKQPSQEILYSERLFDSC